MEVLGESEENMKIYQPQRSIAPSQTKSLAPSKPIRSQKQVVSMKNEKNKKTIFEKDTTYHQYQYPTEGARRKARRKSPLNHIANLGKPYQSESQKIFSSKPESDPYGEVIDYSKLDNEKPGNESVSFLNFVDKMAKRNSIKNRNKYNLKPKNTNPMANSKFSL